MLYEDKEFKQLLRESIWSAVKNTYKKLTDKDKFDDDDERRFDYYKQEDKLPEEEEIPVKIDPTADWHKMRNVGGPPGYRWRDLTQKWKDLSADYYALKREAFKIYKKFVKDVKILADKKGSYKISYSLFTTLDHIVRLRRFLFDDNPDRSYMFYPQQMENDIKQFMRDYMNYTPKEDSQWSMEKFVEKPFEISELDVAEPRKHLSHLASRPK